MIYKKPELDKIGKHASDFTNYICDERKDLGLSEHKGKELIIIDSNSGSGGKIYIDEILEPVFDKFVKENGSSKGK